VAVGVIKAVEKKEPTGAKVTKAAAKKKWNLMIHLILKPILTYLHIGSVLLSRNYLLCEVSEHLMSACQRQTWVLDRRWHGECQVCC
jgi:hypothetical protein